MERHDSGLSRLKILLKELCKDVHVDNVDEETIRDLRTLVSKGKRRYQDESYDLDLSYISPKVIAMGYPSQGYERLFRNPMDMVVSFLHTKHQDNFRVYNLCSELDRRYDVEHFKGRVVIQPFKDHNPPPLVLIRQFCEDADKWLNTADDNVVVVHCKAGKGRTGTMICCYMLHTGLTKHAADAIRLFGQVRTVNGSGVTMPSQIRYIHYYEQCLRENGFPTRDRVIELQSIKITGTIKVSGWVWFVIKNGGRQSFCSRDIEGLKRHINSEEDSEIILDDLRVSLHGDFKLLAFYYNDSYGKQKKQRLKLFHVSLSSNFICSEEEETLALSKIELDEVHKDKKHERKNSLDDTNRIVVCENFRLELHFRQKDPGTFENICRDNVAIDAFSLNDF